MSGIALGGTVNSAQGATAIPRPARAPAVARQGDGSAQARQGPSGPAAGVATVGGAWSFMGPRPINNAIVYVNPQTHIGNESGRVTSLSRSAVNPADIYAGTAGGGVWKSTNNGTTWIPITETAPSLSVGSLVGDTTSETVYVGTGEDTNAGDGLPGAGILKLVNSSFTNVAPSLAGATIGGLAVDHTTAHAGLLLFAATSKGLYQSTGGTTWTSSTAFKTAVTAAGVPLHATQVIQDATNSAHFFAAVGLTCTLGQNVGTAALLETVNKGTSWQVVFKTSPGSRVAIGSGPNNTEYLAAADCFGNYAGLWKSTLGGASGSWVQLPKPAVDPFDPTNSGNGQGDYDMAVGVDPTNASSVVVAGITVVASTNGGTAFADVAKTYNGGVVHPDFHALLFTGAKSFYAGNDGGVWSTTDLGGTGTATDWHNLNSTLAITTFYSGSALDGQNMLGGAQDDGSSGFFNGPQTGWTQYTIAGDGGYTAIDPTVGSHIIYGSYPSAGVIRQDATLANPTGAIIPACGTCSRAAFIAPLVMDPNNPLRLYSADNTLYESKVNGVYTGGEVGGNPAWSRVSTQNLTYGNTYMWFANFADTISSIAMGQRGDPGVVATLSAAGKVFFTTDDGTTPLQDATGNLPHVDVTKTMAGWQWGTQIALNPWDVHEAWVTVAGTQTGGHVWHTTDLGTGNNWQDISGTGLAHLAATSVVVDPREPRTVYVGTQNGAYVCTTCGGGAPLATWSHLGTGLPNTWVAKLTLTRDTKDIVAWTHGRGAWMLKTSLPAGTNLATQFSAAGPVNGLANGPGGVWFTDGASVGVAAADGTLKTFAVPGASTLQDITLGPDGNMWFTDSGADLFGSISPDGKTIHTFKTLQPQSGAHGIAFGPDGNIYVCGRGTSTGSTQSEIYVETTSGTELARIITPTAKALPAEIVQGADGMMYFTEEGAVLAGGQPADQLGIMDPSNFKITEKALPNNTFGPLGIGIGPDGEVWYTEYGNGHVGEIVNGIVKEFPIASGTHGPSGLATGYDRKLWLAMDGLSSAMVRYDIATKTTTSYTLPSSAYEVITGPDGNLWYTTQAGAIGRVELSMT